MDYLPVLNILTLASFGLLTPLVNRLSERFLRRPMAAYWCLSGVAIALAATFRLVVTSDRPRLLYLGLSIDSLSIFFALVFIAVALFVTIASIEYMREDVNQENYYSLLLLATLGMTLVASASDLVVLYVAWELMSISTYALTCIKKRDPFSNEAAVKYFILSALSSAAILYSISLVYGIAGSTDMVLVARALRLVTPRLEPFVIFSIALFISGFGLKMAAVPFHMWIPDAYEGAPTTIGAFLAAGAKKAGFAAAFRVFLIAMVLMKLDWSSAFAIIALLTMTIGNVAALMQKSFTRLLAYSSIAQAGYIMIGFAVPTALGLSGALFHVLNHAVMTSAGFIAAAAVYRKLSQTALDVYGGLSSRMPITSFTLTLSLLALAGVPPLNGFMSKLVLFTAAVDGGMVWLATAAILNSAFSMAYYGWVIKRMYFDTAPERAKVREPMPYLIALSLAAVLIVVLGLYPEPVLRYVTSVISAL